MNNAQYAPQPVASPPVQHQDAGQIQHLPPTYDQAHSPSPGQVGSPMGQPQQYPQQYPQQMGSPAPVGSPMGHPQQGSPMGHPQHQQTGYLTNPTQNNNAQPNNGMPKHEPQLQAQGQQGMVAAVVPLEHLDNNPQWIDCPWCQKRTHTRVEKEGSSMQVLTGVVLCLLCVCLACLPCIAGWFEDTHQFCSNCGKKVATRTHEGNLQVFRPAAGFAVASQFPGQQQQAPQQQPQQSGNAKVA